MTYGAFLIRHPLFWAALTGAALGGALAAATSNVARARRPARARSRKWTRASLLATVAVITATCGVFLANGTDFIRVPSLYVGLGTLVLCAAAMRFPRAGGIPVLIVIGAVTLVAAMVMHPFLPVRGEITVAELQLLSVDSSSAYVEVNDNGPASPGMPRVAEVPGATVSVHAGMLTISDYLFFLGATEGVIFEGLDGDPVSEPYASMPLIGRVVAVVPLLDVETVTIDDVRLDLLRRYGVVATPRAGIEVRELGAPE